MADTQRTISTLLTALFQDGQAAGEIDAQDIRDLIKSLQFSYASMTVSSSAATVIAGAGTYVKLAGTTALNASVENFTMPANNRLVYGGAADRAAIVMIQASLVCGTAAQELGLALALNGSEIAASAVKGEAVSASKAFQLTCVAFTELTNGDYIEAFGVNHTGTNNITADPLHMLAVGLPI